jgi:hypothetical protein
VAVVVIYVLFQVAGSNGTPTPNSGGGGGGGGGGAPAQAPITISGSGIENSAPFHLNGGDYRVTWTATPDSDVGCYHGANLDSNEVDVFEVLANEILDSAAPMSGSTYVYGLDPGRYYINANSGCDWSFTFTQQ